MKSSEELVLTITGNTAEGRAALNELLTALQALVQGAVAANQAIGASAKTSADEQTKAAGAAVPALNDQEQAARRLANAHADLVESVKKHVLGIVAGMATYEGLKQVFGGIKDFVMSSVAAFGEAEAAQKRLTVALTVQGQYSPAVIQQYRTIADELSRTTAVERDAVIQTEALLVQIGQVAPADMKRATQAVADLSAGLGIDLEGATRMVSRALEGNFMSLKRVGIGVDATAFAARGMAAVLEAIESRVGGQAQAELETYAGRVKHIGNMWTETKEALGGFIVNSPLAIAALRALTEYSESNKAAAEAMGSSWGLWFQNAGLFKFGEFISGLEGIASVANRAAIEAGRLAGAAKLLQASGMDSMSNYLKGGPPKFVFPDATRATDPMAALRDQMKAEADVADLLSPALAKLTTEQDRLVRSLLAANVPFAEFPKSLRVSQEQVSLLSDRMKAGDAAAKKYAEEMKKFSEETVGAVNAIMAGSTGEAAWDAFLKLGKNVKDGADEYWAKPFIAASDSIDEAFWRTHKAITETGQIVTTDNEEMWTLFGKQTDEWMKKYLKILAEQEKLRLGITSTGTDWKQMGEIGTKALSDISRVAEMSGHATTSALASVASSVIGLFAKGKPVEAALAGVTGLITTFANTLFKVEERAVNDLRDTFFAAQGGFAALHEKLIAAGAESAFQMVWNAKTTKDWEAGVKAVTAALDAQNQKLADQATLREDLAGKIADTEMALVSLREQAIPTWDQMSALATKYGISVENAGKAVQQLSINATASSLLNDWQTWSKASGDLNAMIAAQAGQISKVVQQSIAFGTTLPENMRSLIQLIADNGLLLDQTGNKITDLSKLSFGASVVTEADKMTAAIDTLVQKLQDLIDQLAKVGEAALPNVIPTANGGGPGYGIQTGKGGTYDALDQGRWTPNLADLPGTSFASIAAAVGGQGYASAVVDLTSVINLDSREIARATVARQLELAYLYGAI